MDGAGWQMAGAAGNDIAVASYLDFLQDDLLAVAAPASNALLQLDASTLAAAQAAGANEIRAQRRRIKTSISQPETIAGDGSNDEDFDASDDDEDALGKSSKAGSKRKASAAAQNKANREKARREKINDRFAELAKMVDPSNEPKTDKLSILGEAIRFVQQTQLENSQLRQLNKFLEEKVGQLEKERGQAMFQMYQFNAMQPAAAAAAAAGPSGGGAGPNVMPPPLLFPGLSHPTQGMPMPAVAMQPLMQHQQQTLASASSIQQPRPPSQQQQQDPQQLLLGSTAVMSVQHQQQVIASGPTSGSCDLHLHLPAQQQQQQQQPQNQLQQPQPPSQQTICFAQQGTSLDPSQAVNQQQQQPSQSLQVQCTALSQGHLQQQQPQHQLQMQPVQTAVIAAPAVLGNVPQQMSCKPMMSPAVPQGLVVPYWPSMMPQSMLDSTQDSLLRPPAA